MKHPFFIVLSPEASGPVRLRTGIRSSPFYPVLLLSDRAGGHFFAKKVPSYELAFRGGTDFAFHARQSNLMNKNLIPNMAGVSDTSSQAKPADDDQWLSIVQGFIFDSNGSRPFKYEADTKSAASLYKELGQLLQLSDAEVYAVCIYELYKYGFRLVKITERGIGRLHAVQDWEFVQRKGKNVHDSSPNPCMP